jgi:hypothetical protein
MLEISGTSKGQPRSYDVAGVSQSFEVNQEPSVAGDIRVQSSEHSTSPAKR